jgi:hypothetical protein
MSVMAAPIRILGAGSARASDGTPAKAAGRAGRLRAILTALSADGAPIRLIHSIEELAVLAAHEALIRAGVPTPYRGDDLGLVLGVEEGIDGIKARYYRGVMADGPLGASPLTFPLTTPNTVAARVSILFDLRGETLTVGGGNVAGAQALGLAVRTLRDGHAAMAMAGGATCVESEYLEAASLVNPSESGSPGGGACLLLLGRSGSAGPGGGGHVLGYGEGFGPNAARDAIQACLEDAAVSPSTVGVVRTAAICDWPAMVRALRAAGISADMTRSPASGLSAASFPLAVAEVMEQAAQGGHVPVLVVGSDCLAGAAAAVVHGVP